MIKRRLVVLIIIALFIVILPHTVLANSINFNDINTWKFNMNQKVPSTIGSIAGTVLSILRNTTVIITVIVLMIIGFRQMLGSVEERAADRRAYRNVIIGVIFVTLVTNIISMIFSFAEESKEEVVRNPQQFKGQEVTMY